MLRRIHSVSLFPFLILLVVGCGGGGGGSFSPAGDQAFGGIWDGIWVGGQGGMEEVTGFSTDADPDTGEARFNFILFPSLIQAAGTVQVAGATVTGTGLAYAPPGDSFPGGSAITGFSFTGTLVERTSISGSWTIDAGESGTFTLDYNDEHLRGASLASLDGAWTFIDIFDPNLSPAGTFDILGGVIFRQTAVCTTMGTITIPDANFNVYEWSASVTDNSPGSCPVAGDYAGLGALTDDLATNDEFDVLISNEQSARPLILLREP